MNLAFPKLMVEKRIVEQCAPTLAGIKCGSLFRVGCPYSEIAFETKRLSDILNPRGVTITCFEMGCGTIVYTHRTNLIERIDTESIDYQSKRGYDVKDTSTLLSSLREMIGKNDCLPHEIGIFLGYPLDDVKGFIDNNGRCPKCIGCWKVYGSETVAHRMFSKIHKCKEVYSRHYSSGTPLSRLVVNV